MHPICESSSSIISTISESTFDDASESQSTNSQNEKTETISPHKDLQCFNSVEEELPFKCILKQVEKDKKDHVYSIKFLCITTGVFLKIAREDSLKTLLKCSAIILALGCLHPSIVGSVACLTGYRVENYNDLYSQNLNTTTNASILFSNAGQGITFLVQEIELAIVPSFLLFKNVYNESMCKIVSSIYNKHISLVKNQYLRTLLYEEANHDLARWESFLAETDEIDEVMNKIAEDKKKMLSCSHIAYATVNQFIRTTKKLPLVTIAKATLVGITALAMHPVIIGIIGCLDSYRAGNPNDLYSTDPIVREDAVNIFSNTGHVVEYACTGLSLLVGAASILFDRKKAIRKIINDIYETRMQTHYLSENTKKFLRNKKRYDLAKYS